MLKESFWLFFNKKGIFRKSQKLFIPDVPPHHPTLFRLTLSLAWNNSKSTTLIEQMYAPAYFPYISVQKWKVSASYSVCGTTESVAKRSKNPIQKPSAFTIEKTSSSIIANPRRYPFLHAFSLLTFHDFSSECWNFFFLKWSNVPGLMISCIASFITACMSKLDVRCPILHIYKYTGCFVLFLLGFQLPDQKTFAFRRLTKKYVPFFSKNRIKP